MINGFLPLLWLTALPAAGNVFGALAREAMTITKHRTSLALHAAAGVLLAMVAVELLPDALKKAPPWVVVIAFIAGGAVFVALDYWMEVLRVRAGKEAHGSGPWTMYASVSIDLISDGLMLGIAYTVSSHLVWVVAIGQTLADIPQGLATMALFQERASRKRRILLAVLLTVPLYIGAIAGYFVLRGRSPVIQYALLAATAGFLTTLSVEEVIPQAQEGAESHATAAIFVLSFAGFVALSSYL